MMTINEWRMMLIPDETSSIVGIVDFCLIFDFWKKKKILIIISDRSIIPVEISLFCHHNQPTNQIIIILVLIIFISIVQLSLDFFFSGYSQNFEVDVRQFDNVNADGVCLKVMKDFTRRGKNDFFPSFWILTVFHWL